jgi:hypothetical protein
LIEVPHAMNWARGLNRIWLLFTITWIVFAAWRMIIGWPAFRDYGPTAEAESARFMAQRVEYVVKWVAIAVIVPMVLRVGAWLFWWIWHGFHQDER